MLTLPDAIVARSLRNAFTSPTWRKAQLLLVGAILTPGQRTVAAALRVMGRRERDYARSRCSIGRCGRPARQLLLVLLLQHLDGGDGPLIFGIDETLCGAKLYRDPVRSVSGGQGQRPALSLMWLGHVPCRTPSTVLDWARQMVMQLRRWLPQRPLVLVGDRCRAGFAPLSRTRYPDRQSVWTPPCMRQRHPVNLA